jgi:hypothetical protein
MTHLANASKISKFLEKTIVAGLKDLYGHLLKGQLGRYEALLDELLQSAFDYISKLVLPEIAIQLQPALVVRGQELGGRKLELRPLKICLSSGQEVEVQSPYVRQLPKDKTWSGSRHMLARHWHVVGKASPGLYSKVGYCSALGPSYELAHQTLKVFGIDKPTSGVRDLTNHLAQYCYEYGEDQLMLSEQETLAGKRVVISLDGGRTRTRTYNGRYNQAGNGTYDTAWKEPKLFVIDILGEDGQLDRRELPIYGCRFDQEDTLKLLEAYLKELDADQAEQVQVLGDGAPWIWNEMQPMLLRLGLSEDRIVQTLDYYHASQYVHNLVQHMPKRVGQTERKAYLKDFKDWLWQGNSDLIVAKCREIYKRPGKVVNRWINYLDKHQDKTQYLDYEEANLMCGSGIVESGIRRIINLRFKNASTFWNKDTVEKLFALRAAMLSGRWQILMNNIENST